MLWYSYLLVLNNIDFPWYLYMFCRAIALLLQPNIIAFVEDKSNEMKEKRVPLRKGEKECEGCRTKDRYFIRKYLYRIEMPLVYRNKQIG